MPGAGDPPGADTDVSACRHPDTVTPVNPPLPAQVSCVLGFDVTEPAEIVLQIAVTRPDQERLSVVCDGVAVEAVELPGADGRQHLLRVPAGTLSVLYTAEVRTDAAEPEPVGDLDRITALRPSRYSPSDLLAGFAGREFGDGGDATATVRAITGYVFEHLRYEPGTSAPTTDATDTLLGGQGVCRDYAHLVAALCRAVGVPARVAAVYAPGLSPMDFHLVVETAIDGRWWVWDGTRLAPRGTLIRIATGRDAADVALATTVSGRLMMTDMQITAVAGGDLPLDDHLTLIALA
jgi:transglutaminase-like putative cysteine protease